MTGYNHTPPSAPPPCHHILPDASCATGGNLPFTGVGEWYWWLVVFGFSCILLWGIIQGDRALKSARERGE